jgi:ERCC4-type nuclease
MKILIDNREPDSLVDLIKNNVEKFLNINIEKKNLDIGDFQIIEENNNIPSIIFERKSISDLLASIKDGRYNEQSFRLDNYQIHNHNIFYLIEGNIDYIKNTQEQQMVYSSMFTLNYFKGFSVINSNNIKQTANIILKFADKLNRENKKLPYYKLVVDSNKEENNNNNYSAVIKTSKKSNITKENILEIMLMQIPNVSHNTANVIQKEYKNLKNLLLSLEKNPNCLDNLRYDNENKRKISKTTIQNIKEYLI